VCLVELVFLLGCKYTDAEKIKKWCIASNIGWLNVVSFWVYFVVEMTNLFPIFLDMAWNKGFRKRWILWCFYILLSTDPLSLQPGVGMPRLPPSEANKAAKALVNLQKLCIFVARPKVLNYVWLFIVVYFLTSYLNFLAYRFGSSFFYFLFLFVWILRQVCFYTYGIENRIRYDVSHVLCLYM